MHPVTALLIFGGAAFVGGVLGGCQSTAAASKTPLAQITNEQLPSWLIAHKEADHVGQCQVAEVGVRPCGGPAQYLVYSERDLDAGALAERLQQYNDAMRAEHASSGRMSTCEMLPKPRPVLKDGICLPHAASVTSR